MKTPVRRVLFFLVVLLLSIYQPTDVLSCGPFFTEIMFETLDGPGAPPEKYANGQLGIILPSFEARYLKLAYRYLSGDRPNRKTRDSLLANPVEAADNTKDEALEQWYAARALVPDRVRQGPVERYLSGSLGQGLFVSYLNVTDDALLTAARTLRELVARFGPEHPAVIDWLKAQDQVFAISFDQGEVPPLCDAKFPYIFQAHRFYQIAAANFYLRKFDLAAHMFGDLASDTLSPWRAISKYLVARALVRKATIESDELHGDSATLDQARVQLLSVLQDQRFASVHNPSKVLLNMINLRIHPQARIAELEEEFSRLSPSELLEQSRDSQDWQDYEGELHHFTREQKIRYSSFRHIIQEEERRIAAQTDETDWVYTFAAADSISHEHAIDKWKQNRRSLPWLLSLVSKTGAHDPVTHEVLVFCRKIKQSSPGYAAVSYHTARLLLENGQRDAARRLLDSVLFSAGHAMPNGSFNRFVRMRLPLSRDAIDYIRHTQLEAADARYADAKSLEYYQTLEFFGPEAKGLNSATPLAVLKRTLDAGVLNPRLHELLAIAAWTRAVVLDKDSMAVALSSTVEKSASELSTAMIAFRSEAQPEARRFLAALTMMRNPGCSPFVRLGFGRPPAVNTFDIIGDNWWGGFVDDGEETYGDRRSSRIRPERPISIEDLLTKDQKQEGIQEIQHLSNIPAPYVFFCEEAIRWARLHPKDPRSPEALHRAIKAGRFGAVRSVGSKECREAFTLLHKEFPGNPWTKRTPYWY